MRVAIASRIFDPEPSAASFRLAALANAFSAAGHDTEVLTVKAPRGLVAADSGAGSPAAPYRVRRWPVLRDKHGYVRGYVQYMSFDIPLFFRVLLGRKRDLIVSEPPPTTGFFVRLAATLRRTPYVYYAADIWSDAASQTGAPAWMVRAVRGLEVFALRGATRVLSVSDGVTNRLAELGVTDRVVTIGNGVNLQAFPPTGDATDLGGPYFLYAGTASEVHGAGIFLDAFFEVFAQRPDVKLVFLGQGSDREDIEHRSRSLPPGTVRFLPRAEPEEVASWLRGAVASLASVRPGQGYDFAFPTKMYAAAAAGVPVVFTGPGPGADFIHECGAGFAADYDASAVADAMLAALRESESNMAQANRERLAAWASDTIGLDRVADRAVHLICGAGTAPLSPTSKGPRP